MTERNRISHEEIQTRLEDGKKYWNVQKLRTEIRKLTKEANAILLQNEDRADYLQLAQRIQGATDSAGKKGVQFVGNLNFKNITELEAQLHGLEEFINYDTLSDEAIAKRKAQFEAAKAKYEATTDQKLTDAEYEKQVHLLTSVSSIVDTYGSENIRNLEKELENVAKQKGSKTAVSVVTAIRRAESYAEKNDITKTPENILDIVYAQQGIKR